MRNKSFKDRSLQDVHIDRGLEKVAKSSAERRNFLIRNKPDLYQELKPMEISRGGTFYYDCKFCGIQGMSIEDAEDHTATETHKSAKMAKSESVAVARFQDRGEAEEALFLNANSEIKVEMWNGHKYFICQLCNTTRMAFLNAKKHILSQAHRKRNKNRNDTAAVDQECKEMRLRIERTGIVYHCSPCAFRTDSIIKNKEHIVSEEHKRLTIFYCHVCKEFSPNKNALQDHRFSIRHKKSCKKLEENCSKPFTKPPKATPPPPSAKSVEGVDEEAVENTVTNVECKHCSFTGAGRDEYEEHVKTASHKRRVFIETGALPTDGLSGFTSNEGERCSTGAEMSLISEAKILKDEAAKDRALRITQDLKERQEALINQAFDACVFTQLEVKTKVRCNTCRKLLSGNEKMLTRQLLAHLAADSHGRELRVQVKAEEKSGVERSEAEREEEAAAAAAESEDESQAQPEGDKIPNAEAPEEEIVRWLKTKSDLLCSMSDTLIYCQTCKTGGKLVRDMLKHVQSDTHKTGFSPAREWRLYIDLKEILEHGDGLFKVSMVTLKVAM